MATSLIAKPEPITPAYNEVKFIYDSTNKNESGFRYIFDVYESGTTTKIAEYRVLPNLSGYGEVDLSRLLQSYVSKDFFYTDDSGDATSSYYKYDVKVGEEYIQTVSYTASLTQNGVYTKITATHSFQVGDQVVITQDSPGTDNPTLDGLHTVTAITGTTDFTVNVLWSEITDATIDGDVAYADNRKTVTRDIITSTNNYVFNGAIPFKDMPSYTDDRFILDDGNAEFLSSMPSEIWATPDQDIWINMLTNEVTTGNVYFENDGGDTFKYDVTESGLITQVKILNNTGLTTLSGSAPLVKSDTKYFDVYYRNSVGTKHSASYRVYIDSRCKINDYEICFLDRLGSIGSFAFQLRDKLTGTVTKEVYNQDVEGYVTGSQWRYRSIEQGMRIINPSIEEVYTLNTNWMDEGMANYFTELVSSPYTWIKIDDVYYSCVVKDTAYEKERSKNKNLIRKTIQVRLSVQDRVNG